MNTSDDHSYPSQVFDPNHYIIASHDSGFMRAEASQQSHDSGFMQAEVQDQPNNAQTRQTISLDRIVQGGRLERRDSILVEILYQK